MNDLIADWLKILMVKIFSGVVLTGFILWCLSPVVAQPTSSRDFSPFIRKQMTVSSLERLNELSRQIKSDNSEVELYERRIEIYQRLLDLNFDNKDWFQYSNNYENDLSRLIKLKGTSEIYSRRGGWFLTRLLYSKPLYPYSPPNKISDLYPYNKYVEAANDDFQRSLQLTSDPNRLQSIYTNLSIIYNTRPHLLVSAPDFSKWKHKIPLKLVLQDFEASIKYSRQALEMLPENETLKKNVGATYLTNAETAAKMGDLALSQKYKKAADEYLK